MKLAGATPRHVPFMDTTQADLPATCQATAARSARAERPLTALARAAAAPRRATATWRPTVRAALACLLGAFRRAPQHLRELPRRLAAADQLAYASSHLPTAAAFEAYYGSRSGDLEVRRAALWQLDPDQLEVFSTVLASASALNLRDARSLRCMRLFLDRFLGPQPDAAAARRACRGRYFRMHPDRAGARTYGSESTDRTAQSLYAVIGQAQEIINDADLAARLYPPAGAAPAPWLRRLIRPLMMGSVRPRGP